VDKASENGPIPLYICSAFFVEDRQTLRTSFNSLLNIKTKIPNQTQPYIAQFASRALTGDGSQLRDGFCILFIILLYKHLILFSTFLVALVNFEI
jgi:hypothetical protein